jgi:hypothetical protein
VVQERGTFDVKRIYSWQDKKWTTIPENVPGAFISYCCSLLERFTGFAYFLIRSVKNVNIVRLLLLVPPEC